MTVLSAEKLKKLLRPVETAKLAAALQNIIPAMFLKIGLTTLISSSADTNGFSFRIREFNRNLLFSYDGLGIEMMVFYRRNCIDLLPMLAVPLVSIDNGRYYAHWLEKPGLTGPFKSIEALMKRYLPLQLARLIKKIPPDTSVYIYLSETNGWSLAKIVNSTRPTHAAEEPFLKSIIRLWNP